MTTRARGEGSRSPTKPEHSETYWQAIKYAIIVLALLMVLALVFAVIVLLGVIPWS